MSKLVAHAKRELELLGEEKETIDGYLKVVQAFADMGHSGASASIAIPVINELLQFNNLRPLTDDPNEWYYHDGEQGFWQNVRNGAAFSHDGGKTYYLVNEPRDEKAQLVMHETVAHDPQNLQEPTA